MFVSFFFQVVIIIPTDDQTTVRFFFQVIIMNRQNIRVRGTPPTIPTDGQMTEHFFFLDKLCIIFAKSLLTNFLAQVHCTFTPMFVEQNAWVSQSKTLMGTW